MNNFRIEKPFEKRPPRLKDLVAEYFNMTHFHVLRAVDKYKKELSIQSKFGLNKYIIENSYLGGAKGRERKTRKVDITEFGLSLLLLYINSPKARMISAEILYRFFILKSYLDGLSENQIGALKGYYRKRMKEYGIGTCFELADQGIIDHNYLNDVQDHCKKTCGNCGSGAEHQDNDQIFEKCRNFFVGIYDCLHESESGLFDLDCDKNCLEIITDLDENLRPLFS